MSILDNRIGGVPVVAIGGGVGVLVVGALYLQSRNAATSTAAATGQAFPEVGNGQSGGATDDSYTAEDSAFTTNAMWSAQAVAFLVKAGHSPLAVANALTKYLNGGDLTAEEAGWVDAAIAKFGLPPNGVQGISEIIKDALTPEKETAVVDYTTPAVVQNSASTSANDGNWTSVGTSYTNGTTQTQFAGLNSYTFTGSDGTPTYLSDRQINALKNPGSDTGAFNGGSGTYAQREAEARAALKAIGAL